jgi:2-amino-4-hydroxy-6-hydroxymethyldihydropteridine diphosphokinase
VTAGGAGSAVDVAIALGSNLDTPTGTRLEHLQHALDALARVLAVRAVSAVYETDPVGPPQPRYLNAVVVGDTRLAPRALLDECLRIEAADGRDRAREARWGPRPLDVDVLRYGAFESADPVLTLPHPRAAERAFVLVPWLDADAGAQVPGVGRVAALLGALPAAERAGVRRTEWRLRIAAGTL